MNYLDSLQKIDKKYRGQILKKYGRHVRWSNWRANLVSDVEIIPLCECAHEHVDLSQKRGKCVYSTGKICLREDAFLRNGEVNEHLLVHEFIHRLSRNELRINREIKIWIAGFDYPGNDVKPAAFNELLTEWIAHDITGIKENTIYQVYLTEIDTLNNLLGNRRFRKLMRAFFHSDIKAMADLLCFAYGDKAAKQINYWAALLDKAK